MRASIVDLRRRTREIIEALERNEQVVITERGQEKGVIIPAGLVARQAVPVDRHPAFGMWKDREDMEDVERFVRDMRERPRHAL